MLGRKGGVEKNIYILCSISVKYLVIIPMLCSLKLKPSSRVQVSPVSVKAVWQNSNQTDHYFVAVQCFIFQHIPTPPLPLPSVRSWSRVSLKNILERRTRNSSLDTLWPPSVRAKRWKMIVWMFLGYTAVHSLVSNLEMSATFCEPSPHKSTIF